MNLNEQRLGFDAGMGWPACGHCGHAASFHGYGAGNCNHVDCIGRGMCTLYVPAERIDPDSPAAFAEVIRGMALHMLPRNRLEYDREQAVAQLTSMISQLAQQWKGWTAPKGTES